jgi:hypothetical protein
MGCHDAVFLEEPPTQGFDSLLDGTLSVEDYLLAAGMEFPEFSRQSCELLRELHAREKKIFQVEPFLEQLAGIHEIFEEGGKPSDIDPKSTQFSVYQVEKKATGALLQYYETVIGGSFEATVETVKAFARADAARLRFRDSLRAETLAPRVLEYPSAYVEAGTIHYALWGQLKAALRNEPKPKAVFLMAPVVKPLLGKRQALGPGDVLTLKYLHYPRTRDSRMDLLAARSLVFVQLLEKDEMTEDTEPFPHTKDEVEAIRMTGALTFEDCRRVFPEIRAARTHEAREVVRNHLQRKRGR